ncbi:MAG: GTP-binding protein [Promethearchaeota archaeon]
MAEKRITLFKELFDNFLALNTAIEAIIVSDFDGFIIAGEKREDIDMEIVSILGTIVNPIMERLRDEFAFKEFGTANFDTSEHRLLFVSIAEETTLSVVLQSMASVEKIAPYAYYIAEKVAQILNIPENEGIQLYLPDFDSTLDHLKKEKDIRKLIYEDKIEEGGLYKFKFIIIGDHQVGKTSIVRRFIGQKFIADYRATMGLNIMTHVFEAFGSKISLDLWDVGAQEFFKRYRKIYYRGAQAAFIVFDLTNKTSFDNVKSWHDELREFTDYKDMPIILIGNKNDLVDDRVVSQEEGTQLASSFSEFSEYFDKSGLSPFSDLSGLSIASDSSILYTETSALNGDNIEYAFNILSYHYIIKSLEIEEQRIKLSIIDEIKTILHNKTDGLSLSFISENPLENPCIELMVELKELGQYETEKSKKKEQMFKYSSGLSIKNHDYDSFKTIDSEGVFCLFDARGKKKIEQAWNDTLQRIIDKIKKNKVILIGIFADKDEDITQMIEEFEVEEKLEKKNISILFFKMTPDNRLDVYEKIEFLILEIKNLLFSY